MKKFIIFFILFFAINCSQKNTVYWCGDHQCLSKKEKEDYFKKTMVVEVKSDQLKSKEKPSKVEIIIDQANIEKGENINIKNILSEEVGLDEKVAIKKQKKLIREAKKLERKRLKEQKKQERITKKLERKNLKEQEKLEIQAEKKLLADEKKFKKEQKNKIKDKKKVAENNDQLNKSTTFSYIVRNILSRNTLKNYPNINNTPD